MKKKTIFLFILLHINFLIYFSSSVVGKYASKNSLFSVSFFLLYVCSLLLLSLYSIFWQQLLKRLPLSVAYANKSVIVIWGILLGWLLFREQITTNMLLGACIIIIGIIFISSNHKS